MFTRIRLENFKSFQHADVPLGPFTLIIGANASGKSNLRDAFRFLHGLGRGYTVGEALTERYSEAGERVWTGIRGGVVGATYRDTDRFGLWLEAHAPTYTDRWPDLEYRLGVTTSGYAPEVLYESLKAVPGPTFLEAPSGKAGDEVEAHNGDGERITRPFDRWRAAVSEPAVFGPTVEGWGDTAPGTWAMRGLLSRMRFLEHDVELLRRPSIPGTNLGQSGDGLSSLLEQRCRDDHDKRILLSWLGELTPMDVRDLEFQRIGGRVQGTIVEADGARVSFDSASDGTLRFLGLLAALTGSGRQIESGSPDMGPGTRLLFLEEIENGLHPSRLHLLVELLQSVVDSGEVQIIATTHAPDVLANLSDEALEHAVLAYRLEGSPTTDLVRVIDLPDAERIVRHGRRADLLAEGWFENSIAFAKAGE